MKVTIVDCITDECVDEKCYIHNYSDPADQDFVVLSPVSSSSVINEAVSYSPLSHLVQSSSFPSNNSSQPPYYLPITQTTSVHTSLSSSKSSSPSVASQGGENKCKTH